MTRCIATCMASLILLAAPGCARKQPAARRDKPVPARRPSSTRVRPEAAPPAAQTIPAPPLRMDVRLHPEELALLPPDAPILLVGRPDLVDRFLAPGSPAAPLLAKVPSLARTAALLAGVPVSEKLGLDGRRFVVAALLHAPRDGMLALENAMDRYSGTAARPVGPELPPLHLHMRLVAALSDPARARATLDALPSEAARLGWTGLRAAASLPRPLEALGARGALLALYREAEGRLLVASIQGTHLVVDLLLSVAGPIDTAKATHLLLSPLDPARPTGGSAAPPPDRSATVWASPLDDPFAMVTILSGADLAVIIRAEALAEAAVWLGMRQALAALREARPHQRTGLQRLAWRIARIPRAFARARPRPFDRFAVLLHLCEKAPIVTLSWRMTPIGQRLLAGILPRLAGRDLGQRGRLVDELLKPLAAAVAKDLPPVEPWLDVDLPGRLTEGGALTWAVLAAEHWPRLLHSRPARKLMLDLSRKTLRLERYVGRVNAARQGSLLHLRLEGRPASAQAAGAPRPLE